MTQLAFDLWPVEPKPLIAVTEPVQCPFCGETEPNGYVFSTNHEGGRDGMCLKARLLLNHCTAIVKHFEGDERFNDSHRNCYANTCEIHYRGEWARKPIPECTLLEYAEKRAWLLDAGVPDEKIPVLPSAARSINEGERNE